MDTRRKIVVDLEFYNELTKLAKKEDRKLGKQLWVILEAYKQIKPRHKEIEKRIVALEKTVLKRKLAD